MKILIFNWRDITHPWAGGAELNIHEQAKRWVQKGHQVTLFCGAYPRCWRHDSLDGIEVFRKGSRFTVYFWAVIYYFLHFRGKYDVLVDLENGIPFFTPLYSQTPKMCIAHHVHTEQFRNEFSPPLSWIGIFLESVAMPLVYRNVPFVTISKSSRDELKKIGVSADKCSIVYPGLEHSQYRPGGLKTQLPSLVHVGRLMSYKRVDMLIEMMLPIVEQCPEVVLHIAGSGPAAKDLKQLAVQYGLSKNIIFHGRVSEDEKVRLLQQAWVFVIASMREGWGLVALEANACGTPVVTLDVPGLREAVSHFRSGLVVKTKTEFVKSVLRILTEHRLRLKLSQGAIEHAKRFNWDETAERVLDVMAFTRWRTELFQVPHQPHLAKKQG